jgi:hypothetical protein
VPIIPVERLQQEYLVEIKDPSNPMEAARIVFEDLKFPEGVPQAVDKLNAFLKNPAMSNSGVSWNAKDLLLLVTANEQVAKGDYSGAEQSLRTLDSSNLFQNAGPSIKAIRDQIAADMIKGRLEQITQTKVQAGETIYQMLSRVLDGLKAEGKYVEMANIITTAQRLQPRNMQSGSPDFPWSYSDSTALLAYASGSQLEKAGDSLAAINEYRRVITSGQGAKYAPTPEAQQGLERIKKADPEAFKDVNGAVLEELRRIRLEINDPMRMQQYMQRNMPPGMGR